MIKIRGKRCIASILCIIICFLLIRWEVNLTPIIVEAEEMKIGFTDSTPRDFVYGEKGNRYENPLRDIPEGGIVSYCIIEQKDGKAENQPIASINAETGELTILRTGSLVVQGKCLTVEGDELSSFYRLSIRYMDIPDNPYTLMGDKKEQSQWYHSNVKIIPKNGYEIIDSQSFETGEWKNMLLEEGEGRIIRDIQLRCISTGAITDEIAITNMYIDKTPPENIEILYEQPISQLILETITLGFYHSRAKIIVQANDSLSGISHMEYIYGKEKQSIKIDNLLVNENTAVGTFFIDAQYKGAIQINIGDAAGNQREYKSDINDKKWIVADTISPKFSIKYNSPHKIIENITGEEKEEQTRDTTAYYKKGVTALISIDESNFFEGVKKAEGCVNQVVIEVLNVQNNRIVQYVPYKTEESEKKQIIWDKQDSLYTTTIELIEDGSYQFRIRYKDNSGNDMVFSYEEFGEEDKCYYEYISNLKIIDQTLPMINISYVDNEKPTTGSVFQQGRKMKINIAEQNFRIEDVEILVTRQDITGTNLKIESQLADEYYRKKLLIPDNWNHSGDKHGTVLDFKEDGIYKVELKCKDLVGNNSITISETFTVDQTKPNSNQFNIKFSRPINTSIIGRFLKYFYKKPVEITLSASDSISGVAAFQYSFQTEGKISDKTREIIIKSDQITYSDNHKTAKAKIYISPQFKGKIRFEVIDQAGNRCVKYNNKQEVIVDSLSPVCVVEYEPDNVVKINKKREFYYNKTASLQVKITEQNFYKQDVVITIKNLKTKECKIVKPRWKQMGNSWLSIIRIKALKNHKNDSNYQITIDYMDRSHNKMRTYQSPYLIIDTKKPIVKIQTSDIESQTNNIYNTAPQSISIFIKERNFNPKDIYVVVTAFDVSGNIIEIDNYSNYLVNKKNWSNKEDIHTTKLVFHKDANYLVKIKYKDMACNQSVPRQTRFTVDLSPPEKIRIDYSKSICNFFAFSKMHLFYNDSVIIRLYAKDFISGLHSISYNFAGKQNEKSFQTNDTMFYHGSKEAVCTVQIPSILFPKLKNMQGIMEFVLEDKAGNKTVIKDDKEIVIDRLAPKLEVEYSKPKKISNGMKYYSGTIMAKLKVYETNFYPEDIKVSIMKDEIPLSSQMKCKWKKENDSWVSIINLEAPSNHKGDGIYKILVHYRDKAFNEMKPYESDDLIIDTIPPSIIVWGIRNESANREKQIGFTMKISEENLDMNSLFFELAAIKRKNNGQYDRQVLLSDNDSLIRQDDGCYIEVPNLETDGIYTLSCNAVDLAENRSIQLDVNGREYRQIVFSVNRNGSLFIADDFLTSVESRYYIQEVQQDILITEINPDPIKKSGVMINGMVLSEGKQYEVDYKKETDSWYEYHYKINKGIMKKEGKYTIIVTSVDKANTTAYSDLKGLELEFVVDRTPPLITVSGVRDNGRYQAAEQKMMIDIKDTGGRVSNLLITLMDEAGVVKREFQQNQSDFDKKPENTYRFVLPIPAGINQQIMIMTKDAAGNTATLQYENVTVSTKWYVLYYANQPLFYGSIIGSVFSIAALVILIRKQKKSKKQSKAI